MDKARHRNDMSVTIVSGDHDRAAFLIELVDRLGLDARQADFTHSSDVILLDLPSCRPALISEMIDYAVSMSEARPILASLGAFNTGEPIPGEIDVRLSLDSALNLAPMRFQFARRILARRAEADLRRESYSRFGVETSIEHHRSPRPILYIGDISRVFPELQAALSTYGHDLTAALSAYTAFDYLHDLDFAAIVLDATSPSINADSFCDMISRSPGLADLPMLVLVAPDQEIGSAMYHRASDLMLRDTATSLITEQLDHLLRFLPPGKQAFLPPSSRITDAPTGLFSRSFFAEHLSNQVEWAMRRRQPLSMMVLRLVSSEEAHLAGDLAHTARIVRSLVRAQDAPCRLDWTRIAVSLPGADKEESEAAARRICDVMDATAFETGFDMPARQVPVTCRIIGLSGDMSATELLAEADRITDPKKTYAA